MADVLVDDRSAENTLEDLETRVAYFEDLLASLDKKIVEQDREIIALQLQLRHLNEKFEGLSNEMGAAEGDPGQELPPHY